MRSLVLIVVVACGDNGASPPAIRFALPDTGVPAPLAVPFPSDVYRDSDGTLVEGLTDWTLAGIDEPEPSALLSEYGALDGFGLQSGIVFGVENLAVADQIDVATLADRAVLVDVETNTPVPVTAGWDAFARAIVVVPEDVLVPGHRYAAAVLAGVTLVDGPALAAGGFGALRDGAATGIYKAAIDALVTAGTGRDQLLAATLYTTSTGYRGAMATAARLFAGAYGAPPAFHTADVAAPYHSTRFGRTTHPGWTATLDEWLGAARKDMLGSDLAGAPNKEEGGMFGFPHDAIAAIVTGSFNSPQFPRPFAKTADYTDGTTAYDAGGNAVPADPTAQIPVVVVIPSSPAPASGYPVVIFQHGLGGDRTTAFDIANQLARNGIATVAIDGPLHGMRDPTASDTKSIGAGTYQGPDGFADSSNPLILLDFVGSIRNMLRTRDLVWQFAFDLVQLRRFVDAADLTVVADDFGGTAPKLDATHVAVIGWSLGGLAVTVFSAIADGTRVDPVTIVSPASNIVELFSGSPVYAAQSTLLAAAANIHPASLDAGRYSAVLQMLEGLVAPADTGGFAPTVASTHNVWLVIAAQDESVPHHSSDQLARAFGATQLTPALRAADRVTQGGSMLRGARVAGYFEVAPGNHSHTFERFGSLGYIPPYPRPDDPRFVQLPHDVTIRQTPVGEQRAISAFIRSTWQGDPVIDVGDPSYLGLLPVADFDDDGFCDADETAAGTDPYNAASKPAGAPTCVRDVGFTAP